METEPASFLSSLMENLMIPFAPLNRQTFNIEVKSSVALWDIVYFSPGLFDRGVALSLQLVLVVQIPDRLGVHD